MSILKTKPTYTDVIATEFGWADSKTGELLVAIKNLSSRIDEEVKEVNVDVYAPKKPVTKKKTAQKSKE